MRKAATWLACAAVVTLAAALPLAGILGGHAQTHIFTSAMLVRPALFILAISLVLPLAFRPLAGSIPAASFAAAMWLVLLYSHAAFALLVPVAVPLFGRQALAVLYVLGTGAIAATLGRRAPSNATAIVGLVLAGGVLWTTWPLVRQQREAGRWAGAFHAIAGRAADIELPARSDLPDIYYIVFDGLGRPDVLQRHYGLDVDPQLARLRTLGVQLPERSRSNYVQTYLSLASALNLNYVTDLAAVMGRSPDRLPLHRLIEAAPILPALKERGYHVTWIGSDTFLSANHPQADSCVCPSSAGPTELEYVLLSLTPAAALGLDGWTRDAHRNAVVRSVDEISRVRAAARPAFVFAHVLAPHPPFVMTRTGGRLEGQPPFSLLDGDLFPGTPDQYVEGYREQAGFVFDRLPALFERLAARERPPIVIVHGDHGSALTYSVLGERRTDPIERLAIFSAYFAPGGGAPVPPDMTPVNALRWALNEAFGTTLTLLPNRSYMSDYGHPYALTEVRAETE